MTRSARHLAIDAKDVKGPDIVIVQAHCTAPRCTFVKTYEFPSDEWQTYIQGAKLIQDIWPDMSDDDREMFISGTCPRCWDELFGSDEED